MVPDVTDRWETGAHTLDWARVCATRVYASLWTTIRPNTQPRGRRWMEPCAVLSEALITDDVSAHRLYPSETALVTSEGAHVRARLGGTEECLRAQPAALFPAPGHIRLNVDDLRIMARRVVRTSRASGGSGAAAAAAAAAASASDAPAGGAVPPDRCIKALLDPPPCPIGFVRVPTGLSQYIHDCLADAPAGHGAWHEGGAVFADPQRVRGIATLALLRSGPVCGVEAAERQQTCAAIAAANSTPIGDHLCVMMGLVDEKDAHKRPCPRDRRPTCAAVARWMGESLEEHACVRYQLSRLGPSARDGILARASVAQCPAGVLCAETVGDAQRKAFLMASCSQFWFAERERWVFNTHTNRYLVCSNVEELKVDAATVYVYLAAALGYALSDPDAPAPATADAAAAAAAKGDNKDSDDDADGADTGSDSRSEGDEDADARAAIRALSGAPGGKRARSRSGTGKTRRPSRKRGLRRRKPPPRVGVATKAIRPHLRTARTCVKRDGSIDMVRLDSAAARNLSLQAFVVFVSQRLALASVVDPLSAVRASGRHTWIGDPPAQVLAPGRHYLTAFFDEGAWGKQARSSKDYFAQRGWAPQGLDAHTQHLTHCANETHAPSAAPSNLFKRPDFGTVLDLDAWWWFEHLWMVPTQPLVDLHDPLRRGRVQTSAALWRAVAPPAELAATRVWIALQAYIMSPSDAAECGQHLTNTAIGRQVLSTARPVAIRAKRQLATPAAGTASAASVSALGSPIPARKPRRAKNSTAAPVPDVDTGTRAVLGGCTTHANVMHYGFVLRSETQPTPDPTRPALSRHAHTRKEQCSEMVFMPPGSRPRPVDVSAARMLRMNPYHPTEQCPVRLANAMLENGLFGANALAALPFSSDDRGVLRGGRFGSGMDGPLEQQIPAPATLRRLHARMYAAVRYECAGARAMLGDAYNFLSGDNPGAAVFAFPLAARAGLTVAETWLILLFYQWVRLVAPLWASDGRAGAAAAAAAAAPVPMEGLDGDEDDTPRAASAESDIPRGIIPAVLAASPSLSVHATTFLPTVATIDTLLRRLAGAWDADVLRTFGFPDEHPTDDEYDAIGATPGLPRLSHFITDLLGDDSARDLARWAFGVMTRARFPLDASRQYGPELERLARETVDRYAVRERALRRILVLHGAALFEVDPQTGVESEVGLEDIAIPTARIPFSMFNSSEPIEHTVVRANDLQAAMEPARARARDQIRARDAHVDAIGAAVRGWLLAANDSDGSGAGIQRDPLQRASAAGAPVAFANGRYVVRLRTCGTPMSVARVAHWVLHGVVRPVLHLVLWVLHPPVAPPVPVRSLATASPSSATLESAPAAALAELTRERIATAWGAPVLIQRHWWPRHEFATMYDAALHLVGACIQSKLRSAMERIGRTENGSAEEAANMMVACARSDRVAAQAVLAVAASAAGEAAASAAHVQTPTGRARGRVSTSAASANAAAGPTPTERFWSSVGTHLRSHMGLAGTAQRLITAAPEAAAQAAAASAAASAVAAREAAAERVRSEAAARTEETLRVASLHVGADVSVAALQLLRAARSEADINAWVRTALVQSLEAPVTVASSDALIALLRALGFTGRQDAVAEGGAVRADGVCAGLRACASLLGATFSVSREDAFAMQQHRRVAERVYGVLAEAWAAPLADATRATLRTAIRTLLEGCARAGATRGRRVPGSTTPAATTVVSLKYPPLAEPRSALTLALVLFAQRHLASAFEVTIDATEGVVAGAPPPPRAPAAATVSLGSPAPPAPLPALRGVSIAELQSPSPSPSPPSAVPLADSMLFSPRPAQSQHGPNVRVEVPWYFATSASAAPQAPRAGEAGDSTVQQRIDTVCSAAKFAIQGVATAHSAHSGATQAAAVDAFGEADMAALLEQLGVHTVERRANV